MKPTAKVARPLRALSAIIPMRWLPSPAARLLFKRTISARRPDALVLPNARKWELPELAIERLQQRDAWHETYRELRETDAIEPIPEATRERAVLKIQDGCNHNCSYCIIPSVRGASVLKSRAQLMHEARTFVREGARELVVTGVSMGDWKSQSERTESRNQALCDLLRAVSQIEGLERVRVSSLDPADVDEEWLQCVGAHRESLPANSSRIAKRQRQYVAPDAPSLHATNVLEMGASLARNSS